MAKNQKEGTKKKKFTLYKLFNPEGNGKGVSKADTSPRTFKNFFKIFWRNIGALFSVNIMCVLGNFPVLIFMFGLSGNLNHVSTTASSLLFSPLYGIICNSGITPASAALFGVHGVQTSLTITSTASYILMGLGALVIFTFGIVNVGTTYILRNIVKGEPLFLWQDFTYAIKRNWKQGLILGIIDSLMLVLLLYDIFFFFVNARTSFTLALLIVMLFMTLIYLFMRFYMYIIMVTFDLKLTKIIKNSFIFALLGLKRNFVAFIGIALSVILTYYLFAVFMPLGIMIPFVILFSGCSFMAAYAAYPKIKEIMIDPYYNDQDEDTENIKPIFTDDVE